jgi:hypothetical protein
MEAVTACLFSPTTCNSILHGAADAVMGDAIGGQSLAVGGAAVAAEREAVSEMAERTAAKTGATLQALPSPRPIDASWGAGTYRQGGLMTEVEHVFLTCPPVAIPVEAVKSVNLTSSL